MADRKKEEFMTHIEHYRAVLDDLQNQRAMHQLKTRSNLGGAERVLMVHAVQGVSRKEIP